MFLALNSHASAECLRSVSPVFVDVDHLYEGSCIFSPYQFYLLLQHTCQQSIHYTALQINVFRLIKADGHNHEGSCVLTASNYTNDLQSYTRQQGIPSIDSVANISRLCADRLIWKL